MADLREAGRYDAHRCAGSTREENVVCAVGEVHQLPRFYTPVPECFRSGEAGHQRC